MFAFGHNARTSVHALPTVCVACVARPILVGVSNTRAHQSVRISFGASCDRARRPWHVSALRARTPLVGMGGFSLHTKPHHTSWCYVGWDNNGPIGVWTPFARRTTTHMEGEHDGSGASGTGHGERGGSFLGSARGMPVGGRPGTITRLPGLPQYPWAPSRTDVPRREFPRHPTHRVLRELAPCLCMH